MKQYKPVPVKAAQSIAETYDKSIVIVLTYDPTLMAVRAVSYGVNAKSQAFAEKGAAIAIAALEGKVT